MRVLISVDNKVIVVVCCGIDGALVVTNFGIDGCLILFILVNIGLLRFDDFIVPVSSCIHLDNVCFVVPTLAAASVRVNPSFNTKFTAFIFSALNDCV